ncbi:MAG: FG-GAP-like repeat-containing protein [Burkholderiales bacterium]
MLGGLIAFLAAIGSIAVQPALASTPGTAIGAETTANGCPTSAEWTDDVLAQVLGVSRDKVRQLHEIRGLTAGEICTMPADELKRAVVKFDQPKADLPGEAARFRAMQQASDDGTVRPDGLVKAFIERLGMIRPTARRAGIDTTSWSALGPSNVGGRLRSVLTHPTDPNLLLAGSVGGGIWRSTDGGSTWAPINDYLPNVAISSMARDPSNPQRIYAGTGEGFYNNDAIRGFGVFVSNDGGSTWSQLGGTVPDVTNPPATQQSDFLYVNRIAVHPTNPDIVLVATRGYSCDWGGVWRTTNATAPNPTFTKVYTRQAGDVRFDPNNGNSALIGEMSHCLGVNADGGGVAWSSDAGASFTRVPLVSPPTPLNMRVEVAWAKATPGLAVAVTEGSNSLGTAGRFWVSIDSGHSWLLNSRPNHLGGQGWYNNAVWVDPTDSTRIVVGGVDLYRGAGAANWWLGNTPVTWTKISQSLTAGSVHADNHAIVEAGNYNGSTNRIVYIGNDGGLYKSGDIAAHDGVNFTANWTNLNNGLAVTQFYGGAGRSGYAGGATRIVGGTQGNGSVKAPASGTAWSTFFGGDGGYAAVDPADANYYYGESVYAAIHRATTGGDSSIICTGIAQGNPDYCGGTGEANFIAPFILDPNNSNTMLVGARSLWRSANVKATTPLWASIKAPDGGGSLNHISAVAVAPGNPDLIWVGHNHGEVYCTTNGTATTPTWIKVTALTATRMVLRILVDPSNSNRVFVAYGGYNAGNLQELTHGSQVCQAAPTVTDRHGNLPQSPIRGLARHPTNANWLYAGTEVGVFATTDGGVTWSTGNEGPGSVSVDELFWLDASNLVAATHGRGMFKAALGSAPIVAATRATDTTGTQSTLNGSVTSSGATTTVSFEYGLTTAYGTSVNATQSPLVPAALGAQVSVTIGGLTCNTTYHYRINALNNAATVPSGDATFKTWICPPDKVWDVFWRKSDGTNAIWQFYGTGPLQFTPSFPPGVPTSWQARAVGDINGDGIPDVVWLDPALGQIAIWLMSSPTTIASAVFPASVGAGSGWTLAGVGDVNGDGRADLVWRNTTTGQGLVWLMNAAGTVAQTWDLGIVPLSYNLAAIADFNGDGRADLLWFQPSDGQVVVWLMAADGSHTAGFPAAVGAGTWAPYRVGDFDGDGKADVFWRDSATGMTAAWYLNGGTLADYDFFVSVPIADWQLGSVRDLDLDGRADLLWYGTANGAVTRWIMNGRHVAPYIESSTAVGVGWQMVP